MEAVLISGSSTVHMKGPFLYKKYPGLPLRSALGGADSKIKVKV